MDHTSSISIEEIEEILNTNVQKLRDNQLNAKVCDDVLKRVKMLVTNWPKLNDKVKVKMNNLAQKLAENELDSADSIHVRLMLDFPSEVSQWMVGIKKLIHELKNLTTPAVVIDNGNSSQNETTFEAN
jgi:hypothetical protein